MILLNTNVLIYASAVDLNRVPEIAPLPGGLLP